MDLGGYCGAAICTNGHIISLYYQNFRPGREPAEVGDFCETCAEAVLVECAGCSRPIRGGGEGGMTFEKDYVRPSFCPGCSKPYPWHASAVAAARELLEELEEIGELDAGDREKVSTGLDDLAAETPRTDLAVSRFRRIVAKVSDESKPILQQMVSNIACEGVKAMLRGL